MRTVLVRGMAGWGLVTLPADLPVGARTVLLRRAVADDVPVIVELLAADQLGATRDGVSRAADLEPYLRAFSAIESTPLICSWLRSTRQRPSARCS